MSPDTTTTNLTRLLTTFDAQRLGEGDVSAGANVIAAMACAIANIHRHGSRIASDGEPSFRIGSSVLAYGPLTSALVAERVESVLAEYQSSLDSHCNEWELAKEAFAASLGGRGTDERFTVQPSIQSLQVLAEEMFGVVNDNLSVLLTPLPNGRKRALLERPLLFASGAQPKQLGAALERGHAGQLLVHDVLRDTSHCADLAQGCLPLIDGCLTVGKAARPVRGHLLLCDPSQVLDEVLREGSQARRLMLRMPWLVDGHAGPSLPVPETSGVGVTTYQPRLDRMEERFRAALSTAWLKRLDYTTEGPETLAFDLTDQQARWVAFLQQKETDFPGITAAARPLLATLLFGLNEMVRSLPKPDGAAFCADDAEALARILIHRMFNARAIILHDASKEDRERKLQVMFDKLSAGSGNPRNLARKHHRLPVSEARDLLDELVTRGRPGAGVSPATRKKPAHHSTATGAPAGGSIVEGRRSGAVPSAHHHRAARNPLQPRPALACMKVANTVWRRQVTPEQLLPDDPRVQHFHRALMKRLVHMPMDYAFNVQRLLRELPLVCIRLARVICEQGGGADAVTLIGQDLFRSTLRAVVIGVASLAYHGWGFHTGVPRAFVQKLMEHLRSNGPQTRRDLQRKFPQWLKAVKRDALLNRLSEVGLVICPDTLVSAVPLSEFIDWLQRRPAFPTEGCLSSLLLGKKCRQAGPLPGPPLKKRRVRKPKVAVKAAAEEHKTTEATPEAA